MKQRCTLLHQVWTAAADGVRRSWRLRRHIPCVHAFPVFIKLLSDFVLLILVVLRVQ